MIDMLNSGVLVRSFLGVLFGLTVCALVLMSIIPPDWFLVISSMVIGYWFGSDGIATISNSVKKILNGDTK